MGSTQSKRQKKNRNQVGSTQSKRQKNANTIPEIIIDPLENPDEYWKERQQKGFKQRKPPLVHLMENAIIHSNYDVLEWYCFNEIYETDYWTREEFKNAILRDKLGKSSGSDLLSLCRKTGKLSALRILGI